MRYYTLPSSKSGAISPVGEPDGGGGEALAYWVDGHVLAMPDALPVSVATWSGTVVPKDEGGLFAADVRNWSVAARGALHERLDRIVANAASDGGDRKPALLLRPHARHVLNDWHTCARFMVQREVAGDQSTRLLVDPAALLTEQMLPRAAEHLERTFEQVGLVLRGEGGGGGGGGAQGVAGVLVSNLRKIGSGEADPLGYDQGEGLTACPIDDAEGVLDGAAVCRLMARHLPRETAVVLVGGGGAGERQLGFIERAAGGL